MIRSKTGRRVLRGGVDSKRLTHAYEDIISVENLLEAWKEFVRGKKDKKDVQEFQYDLMHNIFELNSDLKNKTYQHGPYHHFKINDPKPRDIHKATVRDRLLHHAIYRILYPYFDTKFIYDSYSCRIGKGTHKAMDRFRNFTRKVSKNHTKTVWVLKCDIKKFFASIDQETLITILKKNIQDENVVWLLGQVICSFATSNIPTFSTCPIGRREMLESPKGLPLGNLTSQLLVNIYMNEFDRFVKHTLKAKYYIRYADDFVLLSQNKQELKQLLIQISLFLQNKIKLQLHPNKVSITTFASGIDFLGWVHFPNHRVLRTSTKRRMFKRTVGLEKDSPTVQSYVGMLGHGDTYKLHKIVFKLLK